MPGAGHQTREHVRDVGISMTGEGSNPKVLLVRGGWTGHEPQETSAIVARRLKQVGFDVDMADSLAVYRDAARMERIDLIVQCWTMGEISNEEIAGLLGAIRSGTGLSGWHGGLCDSFRASTAYQFAIGGQWVAHPGGKIDYRVDVVPSQTSDPIVRGMDHFTVHSEQYYLHVDPANEVLATTTFRRCDEAPWIDGCVMPVAWKRSYGAGRVFYSSIGHDTQDFDVPEVLELIVRGSSWASRRRPEVTVAGLRTVSE